MRSAASRADGVTPNWLAALVADAAAIGDMDEIMARLAPLFTQIDWLAGLAGQAIATLRADPAELASLPASRNGPIVTMTLAAAPPIRLMLSLIEGAAERADAAPDRPASVGFAGNRGLYRLLSPRPVDAILAYAPPGATRCRSRTIRWQPGRMIALDERRLSLRLLPQEHPVLLLRARIERTPPLPQRRYALATGAPLRTVQGDDGFARSAMLLSLLREAGARSAVPAMIDMLAQKDANARWVVMRELLALDARAGLPHLRAMAAQDPHSPVRAAAQAVLDRLEERAMPCPA